MSAIPFTHPQLANSKLQIRLLKITPADDFSSSVECTIDVFDLATAPAFHAISYTWGDPVFDHIVHINSCPYPVTFSCWYALKQERARFSSKYTWIDSICINQADNLEKSHQVGHMNEIFAGAATVHVSLGCHANNSDFLLRSINTTSSTCLNDMNTDSLVSLLTAWTHLFLRPYFSRLWIIPELIHARELLVMLDESETVSFADLQGLPDRFGERACEIYLHWGSKAFYDPGSNLVRYQRPFLPIDFSKRGVRYDFEENLYKYAQQICYDKRDRIFVLARLSAWPGNLGEHAMPLQADYSKSALLVAIEAIEASEYCQRDSDQNKKSGKKARECHPSDTDPYATASTEVVYLAKVVDALGLDMEDADLANMVLTRTRFASHYLSGPTPLSRLQNDSCFRIRYFWLFQCIEDPDRKGLVTVPTDTPAPCDFDDIATADARMQVIGQFLDSNGPSQSYLQVDSPDHRPVMFLSASTRPGDVVIFFLPKKTNGIVARPHESGRYMFVGVAFKHKYSRPVCHKEVPMQPDCLLWDAEDLVLFASLEIPNFISTGYGFTGCITREPFSSYATSTSRVWKEGDQNVW